MPYVFFDIISPHFFCTVHVHFYPEIFALYTEIKINFVLSNKKHSGMTMHIKAVIAALFISLAANAQNIEITRAKFHTGDNPAWKSTAFNDNKW